MTLKKLLLYLIGISLLIWVGYSLFLAYNQADDKEKVIESKKVEEIPVKKAVQPVVEKNEKADLYSESLYDMPLISIAEISKLSKSKKKIVDNLLENSQGFYYLKVIEDKIFVILQNPVNTSDVFSRHDLQFAEILSDGKIVYHNAGYFGYEGEHLLEDSNEVWTFDESVEVKRPLKHVVYDEKGKIKFTEHWSYNPEDEIKYIMKDSHDKEVSILKESQDNESHYRKEHIFYDNDSQIKMSLTVNYDGANITRMTFYNSHDLVDSVSVFSDYVDGIKTRESVYNEKYELQNTVIPTYKEGIRAKLSVLNAKGEEILSL